MTDDCEKPIGGESAQPRARGLRQAARLCIEETDRARKVSLTEAFALAWRRGELDLEDDADAPHDVVPGLPTGLVLVPPTKVKRRGFGSSAGLAAFVHAIAHIEWNAINLAWDHAWRFGGMPREYVDDWVKVAAEEATHYSMLRRRLLELGSDYGRLPAHDGLWQTAHATRGDVLDRMALVPRVLEARGLDVTPGLITRLRAHGDEATASILDVVLADEIGHVRIGSRWFHWLCRERGLDPAAAFEDAITRHFRGRSQPVVDEALRAQRLEAGFLDGELEALERLARRP
jgi:uncharacterized ferritin-like protein (DUF455 family)